MGLGINVWMFVSQLVSFLILFLVLQRWGFPILIKTLDNRAHTIQEGVENAERARKELADAQQRIEGLMLQARQEAQQTLAQAIKAGEHLRTEIEQEARDRARQIVDQAEQ